MDYFETEAEVYDYTLPVDDTAYVSEEPQETLIIGSIDGNENTSYEIPDAIPVEEGETGLTGSAEVAEDPVSEAPQELKTPDPMSQGEPMTEDPVIKEIYRLLDERLPKQTEQEGQAEEPLLLRSDPEESELQTEKIYESELNDIRSIESEQTGQLVAIKDNLVVANNNNVHLLVFSLAVTTSIWASLLFYFLFRNIK